MKKVILIFLLFISTNIFAQDSLNTSNSFTVSGKVKSEKTFSISDIRHYKSIELKEANISCSPRKEDKAQGVKVVLLKDILDSVEYDYVKSKMLNQFYFLFIASDGYKLVYSFNEIYNTETGNNLYIVTGMDGKDLSEMDNRILMLTTKDIKQGTRNMKWLSKIVVCYAE